MYIARAVACTAVLLGGCRGENNGDDDGVGSDGGTDAGDDGSGDDGAVDPTQLDGVGEMGMRRLTRYEYDNTLRDILGDETRPGSALLPEEELTPFDNDFRTQEASRVLIEAAETLAGEAALRLIADTGRRDNVVGCAPSGDADGGCMRAFVTRFGRLALRRGLTESEVDDYVALGLDYAGQASDFYVGVEVVVRGLLQEMEFLYRVEIGAQTEVPGLFRLNGYEVATRLAYFIWGSTPDEGLLDAAEAGDLDTPGGIRSAAQTMLSDTRAMGQIDRFHAVWLGYQTLPHAPALTVGMRLETAALLQRVLLIDTRPWVDLFTATETFVDDTLAAHYGLEPPGSAEPAWVDYGSSGRQGILSHGSFLSAAAGIGDTSPTRRGKAIRERLLCDTIPPPPPDVDADNPPDPSTGTCKVDRYAVHAKGACAGCHSLMDSIGFGFENYDGAGVFRAHDDGAPECTISGEGELAGVGTFVGPAGFAELVLQEELLDACLVRQLYRYAMGHQEDAADEPFITTVHADFRTAGLRFDQLVLDVVAHDAFGFRLAEGQ